MDEDTYMKSVFAWKYIYIYTSYILEWTHKHLHRTSQWEMQRTKAHQPGVFGRFQWQMSRLDGWDLGYWMVGRSEWYFHGYLENLEISWRVICHSLQETTLCRGWSPGSKDYWLKVGKCQLGIHHETWLDPIFWKKKHQQLRNSLLQPCWTSALTRSTLCSFQMLHQLRRCRSLLKTLQNNAAGQSHK